MARRRGRTAGAPVHGQQRQNQAQRRPRSHVAGESHRGVPLGYLGPEHATALDLTRIPVSVAEVAAHLKLPAAVTKVLLSDLLDCGALTTKPPEFHHNPTDRALLEAVLDGLRRQL